MEVKFHLPGLYEHYVLNMVMAGIMEQKPEFFRENAKIASFYGEFPVSLWNGGRLSESHGHCDKMVVTNAIKRINDKGISVRYTYTNMLLEEDDLKDDYCNFCMNAADNGMNAVIVVSPLLESYIRENYPSFKIVSSTCKCIKGLDNLNEELEKDYELVVINYKFNNSFDELEKIKDKKRCEILVNSSCHPECKEGYQHYLAISKVQRMIENNQKIPVDEHGAPKIWNCRYCRNFTRKSNKEYSTYIKPDDVWEKYVPMGFTNFKLEGRNSSVFSAIENCCSYLAKPEYKEDVRLIILDNLVINKFINVNYFE